jgi:hypothetical protein
VPCILILTHRSISGAWSASDWVLAHGGNGALTQRACLRDACEDSTETLLRLPLHSHSLCYLSHLPSTPPPPPIPISTPPISLTMAAQAPPTSTGSTKLDAVKQNIQAAEPEKLSGVALYSRFAFAGAVCCSLTHGGLTPVDV